MGFESTKLSQSWNKTTKRTPLRRDISPVWNLIGRPRNIVELGPCGIELANQCQERFSIHSYRAFDVSPSIIEILDKEFQSQRERSCFASVISSDCALPLPSASQDLFLSCEVLNLMRMDQLYMLCAEARRVLRTGGHWALAANLPARGLIEKIISNFKGQRNLDLTHYISPEDWETLLVDETRGAQLLLLRRLAS